MMTEAPESNTLLEIFAEHKDPAKWASMQILKGGRAEMTQGEAADLIEATCRKAIQLGLVKIGQMIADRIKELEVTGKTSLSEWKRESSKAKAIELQWVLDEMFNGQDPF